VETDEGPSLEARTKRLVSTSTSKSNGTQLDCLGSALTPTLRSNSHMGLDRKPQTENVEWTSWPYSFTL